MGDIERSNVHSPNNKVVNFCFDFSVINNDIKMKKLTIESIRLEGNQVQCSLLIGKNRELLITNINETCLPFLCIDRIDAYVVGFYLSSG